jgi:hypothetical protein
MHFLLWGGPGYLLPGRAKRAGSDFSGASLSKSLLYVHDILICPGRRFCFAIPEARAIA